MYKNKQKIYILIFIVCISLIVSLCEYSYYKYTHFVPVLMYHNVVDKVTMNYYANTKNADIFISSDKFREQMKFLKENGYKTLTLDEFSEFIQGKKRIPSKSILITFDNGRKNIYINAYPILKEYGFKGTVFLITSKYENEVQKYNPYKWQYLSWREIKQGKDVFEYASHTHNLHYRTKKNNTPCLISKTDKEIEEDILKSLKYINKPYFAYPYGRYKYKNIKILKKSGIKLAFSTHKGQAYIWDCPYTIKRNNISENTSINSFKKIIKFKN